MSAGAIVARRSFTALDQDRFAALSGDWNPLHVDAIAARRTMLGAPVVHGVHLLLWALDRALEGRGPVRLERVTTAFRQPVYLEEEVVLTRAGDGKLQASVAGDTVLEVDFECAAASGEHPAPSRRSWPVREAPLDVAKGEHEGQSGELPVAVERELAAQLLPALCGTLLEVQIGELLATTRLVGMLAPGLHSIFSGLELRARPQAPGAPSTSSWRVQRVNLKYSSIKLAVEGPTLTGVLNTFRRPAPLAPLPLDRFLGKLEPGEFAAQRAVVIGGTRGIGEALAKALATGGAEVVITYQRGKQEAEAIGREAAGAGVSITPLPFDVTAEPDLALLPAGFQPTHLYYLATPFIRLNAGRRLDLPALARFMDFYVAGLYRTVEAFSKRAAGPLLVWLPSTVFLESLERGAAPYCIAKAAMEELARQLPTLLPVRVVAPRLPRAATDQTAGLLESLVTDRAALAVEQLRELARG